MKIAFLGDSITLGYGLANQAERYATLVSRALGAEEKNLGITGTLVARAGLNRDDGRSFLDRLPLIEGADAAVIFGGTNDYFWSDRPIYPPTGDGGTDYFYNAMTAICEALVTRYRHIRAFLVTPYPHHGVGNFAGGSHFKDASEHDTDEKSFNGQVLKDYADATVRLGGEYGIPVLSLFEAEDFVWQKHTLDGCHPNAEGHRILAEHITAFLKKALG